MGKVFMIDVAKCVGCYACQLVCKEEHCDSDWLPYARVQPITGSFWRKVDEKERGQFPKVYVTYISHACMHCENCEAAKACSENAFVRREDGLSFINPSLCTGCGKCARACPYGSVYMNNEIHVAQKCTGCAHLLDDGWKEPRCVESCAPGALRFGDEEDFAEEIKNAEFILPDKQTNPRTYYLNLPKRFVAGQVYNASIDEVIIGASVTLFNNSTEEYVTIESDEFGDFWFRQVEPADYTIYVEAEGFMMREVGANALDKDLNVGAIALYPDK